MTAEANVETAVRFTEAVARGDYETAAAELHPSLEIDDTDIPEATGTDSFYKWMSRWDESWESWRIEDFDTRGIGDDRTISFFRMVATGKSSGIALERRDAVLADYRDGKIARLGYYNDQAQAAEAAGVEL